jgi:hypothetical protein
MKRIALVLILVVLATAAFAIDLSAGLGATVGYFSESATVSIPALASATVTVGGVPLGFMAFFDATYVQASVGYMTMVGLHMSGSSTILGVTSAIPDQAITANVGELALTVLGRYPIKMKGFTLSPMLGIEYDIDLVNNADVGDLNLFWFKGGVAADFMVSKKVYIRPELLLGFALLTQAQKDALDAATAAGLSATTANFMAQLSVLVGYKF